MKLIIVKGSGDEKEFRLHDGINTVGRGITNRIRLLDPRVSRRHCRIRKIGLSLYVSDLGTKNGTLVNGESVVERELKLLDEIKVGKTTLRIVEDDYSPQLASARGPKNFLQSILRLIRREAEMPDEMSQDEFAKFTRRSRKKLWRPQQDTDPPEGYSETVSSHTDPDLQ